ACTADRWILQFEVGAAVFAVWARIAEIPGERDARDLYLQRSGIRRMEALRCPDGTADQVEADEQNGCEHSPDRLESGVAVGIGGLGLRTAISIAPGKKPQGHLRGQKYHSHGDKGDVNLVV